MLQVELLPNGFYLDVYFKHHEFYNKRMERVPGAVAKKPGVWMFPIGAFEDFEEIFEGEIVYITPRHKILGEAPPPPPQWYFEIPNTPVDCLKHKLYPFQQFGANFLVYRMKDKKFAILCDQMGLGKTPQAIAAAEMLAGDRLVKRVLVLCLSSLKKQWAIEGIEKFTGRDAIVIKGTPDKRRKLYAQAENVRYTILNYELLLKDMQYLEGQFDMVIMDEAHKLKNHEGKMNLAACKLGANYYTFLTGTPMMNRPEELFGLFQIADPSVFGKFSRFKKDYLSWFFNPAFRATEKVGVKNLPKLREEVGEYILRRTDEEVKMDLPDIIYQNLDVESTPLQRDMMKMIDEEIESMDVKRLGLLRAGKHAEAESIKKAQQGLLNCKLGVSDTPELLAMSKSERLREKYGNLWDRANGDNKRSPKLELCLELVEEIVDQGYKLVIFSQYETMTRILERELNKLGVSNVRYVGKGKGMSENQREANKEAFQSDPSVKVLISTEAGSTGLNLQAARYVINYDLPWNPSYYDQRNGRIRRLDSKFETVYVYNLLTNDTLDLAVWRAIKRKKNLSSAILDNTETMTETLKKLMV